MMMMKNIGMSKMLQKEEKGMEVVMSDVMFTIFSQQQVKAYLVIYTNLADLNST